MNGIRDMVDFDNLNPLELSYCAWLGNSENALKT